MKKFTLVELIVVMTIVIIVAAMVYNKFIEQKDGGMNNPSANNYSQPSSNNYEGK